MKKIIYFVCLLGLTIFSSCQKEDFEILAGHKFIAQDETGDAITLTFFEDETCEVIEDIATSGYFKSSEFDYTFNSPTVRIYFNRTYEWKEDARGTLYMQGTYNSKEKTITHSSGQIVFKRVK